MDNQGVKLKALIKESAHNQKEFAKLVGVDPNYISMMINGTKPITDNFLLNVTKVMPDLDVSSISNNEAFRNKKPFTEKKEIYLEKNGVKISEEEILIWLYKNLKLLMSKENSIYHLVFKEMVNEKVKETIEKAGFEVEMAIKKK